MELLACKNSLMLVDATIFGKGCKVIVVKDSRNDTLSDDSMSTVVNNSCSENMQTFAIKNLKSSQTKEVVICLSKAWIVFL